MNASDEPILTIQCDCTYSASHEVLLLYLINFVTLLLLLFIHACSQKRKQPLSIASTDDNI